MPATATPAAPPGLARSLVWIPGGPRPQQPTRLRKPTQESPEIFLSGLKWPPNKALGLQKGPLVGALAQGSWGLNRASKRGFWAPQGPNKFPGAPASRETSPLGLKRPPEQGVGAQKKKGFWWGTLTQDSWSLNRASEWEPHRASKWEPPRAPRFWEPSQASKQGFGSPPGPPKTKF